MNLHHRQKVDFVRGIVIFRKQMGVIEYLLLKKAREDDWTPPKGKKDGAESEIETAHRETNEETFLIKSDYELLNQRIYFEYQNDKNILKKVTMWPAKLVCLAKVIQLSPEHEKYLWLPIDEAINIIKVPYRRALIQAHKIVRRHSTSSM